MAVLHACRQHNFRLPCPRAQRTPRLPHMGISAGSGAVRCECSRPALLHLHGQTAHLTKRHSRNDAGPAGGNTCVSVFCEEKEKNRLTTKDTKEHQATNPPELFLKASASATPASRRSSNTPWLTRSRRNLFSFRSA